MKKLILIALMSAYAMSGFINEAEMKAIENAQENKRLCKVFIKKAHEYQDTMRSDELATATFDSYKERVVKHCSTLALKSDTAKAETVKPVQIAKVETKVPENNEESARLCNVFTKKVESYESAMRNDDLAEATLVSYKKRMSAYCGTTSVRS